MTETFLPTTNKDMESKIKTIVQDSLKKWETQFESNVDQKLSPLREQVIKTNQFLEQLMTNKSLEYNFETHKEETFNSRKDHHPSWFLISQHHTLGDTHHEHRGNKLDMHKFDGTYPTKQVSEMEHFFYLHNICTNNDKCQVVLLYLDVEY